MALTKPADIVDLATYREAAAHPCAYCGKPCPANDRLPGVARTVGGSAPDVFDLGDVKEERLYAHAACAMRAELGRGFGFAP